MVERGRRVPTSLSVAITINTTHATTRTAGRVEARPSDIETNKIKKALMSFAPERVGFTEPLDVQTPLGRI